MHDASNGFDAIADEFIAGRGASEGPGPALVREWARDIPAGSAILDLGCGPGAPIAQALGDDGYDVHGVDASPRMIAAFRARFPAAPVECGPVETSRFFDRTFPGVLAWGLLFLLDEGAQEALIGRVAAVLEAGGRFLFTAPRQRCEWPDRQTRQTSRSLGAARYGELLRAHGLVLYDERDDEGGNHYYFARKG